jgi:hypothetical protein
LGGSDSVDRPAASHEEFSISDGPRTRLEPVPVAVEEEVSSAFTCTPAHLKTLGESRITTFQNSIRTPTL